MTRKQAERVARTIVERVRKEATSATWTEHHIADAALADRVREAPQVVWGCLPRGWGFALRGHSGLTVTRPPAS